MAPCSQEKPTLPRSDVHSPSSSSHANKSSLGATLAEKGETARDEVHLTTICLPVAHFPLAASLYSSATKATNPPPSTLYMPTAKSPPPSALNAPLTKATPTKSTPTKLTTTRLTPTKSIAHRLGLTLTSSSTYSEEEKKREKEEKDEVSLSFYTRCIASAVASNLTTF